MSSRLIASNLFVVMGIPYLTPELLRHPLWAISFYSPPQGFPDICFLSHLLSQREMVLNPRLLQCHRTSHYVLQWGETRDGGGKEKKVTQKQEAVSKRTKASAVHWERQGTYCQLSQQVMAGSCSQYLTRWGKWAIPPPWSYAQTVFCTTFLTGLTYWQNSSWAHLHSRGHRENRTSLSAAQELFSALPSSARSLRRAKPAQGYTRIADKGSQPSPSLAYLSACPPPAQQLCFGGGNHSGRGLQWTARRKAS